MQSSLSPVLLALFLLLLPAPSSTLHHHHHRRLLHHPFFPLSTFPPSPSPSSTPNTTTTNNTNNQPKLPSSTLPTTTPTTTPPLSPTTTDTTPTINPFFQSYPTLPPPPPPPPSTTALVTFPANISSLALPTSSPPPSHSSSLPPKLLATTLILSFLAISLTASLAALLRRRHHRIPPPTSPPQLKLPPPSPQPQTLTLNNNNVGPTSSGSEFYLKLCTTGSHSPELNPLPPLPKHSFNHHSYQPSLDLDDDQFFSPTASSSDISADLMAEASTVPPPPPPPPPRHAVGPPEHVAPTVFKRRSVSEEGLGIGKAKLKALHWDKVRASSGRVMVWDHLKPGSFQLNEEMIETLFKVNSTKEGARRSFMPLFNEETRVLDPKKSQNIAILLKALNVTEGEVCDALLEGNVDSLGTELLESLLRMAPTPEEENKLKDYNDESPLKLGPAEKFLKAVVGVPFAFKRVDAMLYIANFDSEVEYLRKSFETLEAACEELRNSRMFLKLLEAVLKTGNRMNVGTNRGDAQAFKLDTLLKLADIKGTDGKTTLLHFVVQEMIRAEGSRPSLTDNDTTATKMHDQHAIHDDIESRKLGLEVVAGLGGELTNVKKAAAMDSDSLSTDVGNLARGIIKVNQVLHLSEVTGRFETKARFSETMNGFLKKAELDIVRIQSQESSAFSTVKDLTEYFHGNLAKEEAHPLRTFMVVRDFLSVLGQVCKEVGKIIERTTVSTTRPFPVSVNLVTPFSSFNAAETQKQLSSDDDESIIPT